MIIVKLKAGLLLNKSLCICPLTFITEALHLVATVLLQLVPHYLSLQGKRLRCAVLLRPCLSILSAASIIRIKKLKSRKSHKTCLTNHTQSKSHHLYHTISCHWLLMPVGWMHTYMCQRVNQSNFKKPGAWCTQLKEEFVGILLHGFNFIIFEVTISLTPLANLQN